MNKFGNKYRSETARAQWWDYSANGCYFITVCTSNREHLFGKIEDGEMYLSGQGEIVQHEFEKSFEIRAELFCDAFVIMPNHIHARLRIDIVETHGLVGTHGRASPQTKTPAAKQNSGVAYRAPKSISSFMAGFKSPATARINGCRKTPKLPVWQTFFHDHIIRNEEEYQRIKKYIENNMANWEKDIFNKTNK